MRNIIRIGAGTDGRNRFVAIALGVALAAGPAAMMPAAALAAPATDAAAASTTAGATITLQGADGASLAGHTFNVYRIGTYTDQILNGTQISSLGVRGDTASNAWAADAIGIANAYDPSTADDIAKVYGYDDAGNIANIKMDSQTRQLRNISKALAQSTRKPAAIQGGANLTTTQSTLTINVPAEGLYYITDSAGNPIMVGTKSGNANIMKNDAKDPQWRTLGTAVVKSKSMRVDKKVQVQRNGTTVGKDGTASDPVGVTVGDTVTNTVEVTVPNKQAASAVKFKLIDQPKGQTYVKGSLSVRLKNAPRTDITADAVVYDGTTQNNAKSIPGDPTLKTTDAQTAAQTAVDKANTAVAAAQAKIDTADKQVKAAAKNKTDAEATIKQANTDKTKALADLADAKAAKAEAEKAKQAALEAKTVSDAKVEAAAKQVKAADEAIADAKAAYAKAKDDLNTATGKLNDAQNTIKRLQNAEENLKKANAKLADAQAKLDEANKAKDEADKAYEKAKADYDAKLADKQASDKELAAAKQAEAEAQKKAEEEAKKQQEAQKKADQAKKDAEAKKQKAEQAKKQAAGVTNNGLASTGSDTTAIATLAAIMTIAGAGCVLVRVRSAKHADGWHAVED